MSSISTTNTLTSQKTIQQIIDESSANSTASERKTGELGKNDFLNLLVTQLQYQDPLNPTDNTQFISQMAQFSSLEEMQNLNESFSSNRAYSLIGKNVTATVEDTDGSSKEVTGDVTSVKVRSGVVYVVVDDQDIKVEDVTDVSEGSAAHQSNMSGYTALIGCDVTGLAYDATNGSMIKVAGQVNAIQKGIYEDYAILDGVDAQVSGIYNSTSTSASFVQDKLEQAKNSGEAIDIIITDSSTGKTVPVSAKIRSYKVAADGTITAVLDQMSVPVEGITKVTKAAASTTDTSGTDSATDTEAATTTTE
jgi:flagellar basal-body rod modification protein FlgD